jgi:sec-independent protein translocase protein TatC
MESNIIECSPFCFSTTKVDQDEALTVDFSEHLEELRQRIFQSLIIATFITLCFFLNIQWWVQLLANPVSSIKFIQLAPGEYFISTVKIAIYAGLLFSVPVIGSQLIFYIVPGLNEDEKEVILPLLFLSTILFILGLLFSYKVLVPAALSFFISYSSEFVEPLWSFDEYLNFVTLLFFTTGLTFQIPLIQVGIGLAGIVSSQQMMQGWKYVLVGSTIVGAIVTPSTDPITQLCLSVAILFLYGIGIGILQIYKK